MVKYTSAPNVKKIQSVSVLYSRTAKYHCRNGFLPSTRLPPTKKVSVLYSYTGIWALLKDCMVHASQGSPTLGFNVGAEKLTGVCEADETFIGGDEKNKHKSKRTEGTQGRR